MAIGVVHARVTLPCVRVALTPERQTTHIITSGHDPLVELGAPVLGPVNELLNTRPRAVPGLNDPLTIMWKRRAGTMRSSYPIGTGVGNEFSGNMPDRD